MSSLAAKILTKDGVPPAVTFASKPKTLYELLNVQRSGANAAKVMPHHWFEKGFEGCYYQIHRVRYKWHEGGPTHGRAWGILHWRGKPTADKPSRIRGGLKFSWRLYESPEQHGVTYDPERARTVERRRTNLLMKFLEDQKQ
ncbi:hypothetical protein IWW55_001871 [Coemansia sp. RSA 2706]|nr:hypothetical protein LPJ63_003564 [Coemansia sp. RSA 2711]KAJ1843354.1 hypothetical protein LPJ70_003422 [Coemansia sp. RSA 2708]KAJ2305559.1 hypothetical protein IWW55_001871 [Coemansia sp. RSA 2706]KAJ2311206.1 hypothetical protein IWW54_002773 [Coemansia sp. RSA 2705]KAJ2318788.1 hypothetical protein IWW52_002349 [Coemansia sp. RSA 2704]KAJ2735254.1 hypothetical protein H4R23_002238 [Coemansia sp. Cherry 401B]